MEYQTAINEDDLQTPEQEGSSGVETVLYDLPDVPRQDVQLHLLDSQLEREAVLVSGVLEQLGY